jgi:serine O-acetyltransferase
MAPSERITDDEEAVRQRFWRGVRARHPHFRKAVLADARLTLARRDESAELRTPVEAIVQVLRLMLVTDAFAAQVMYRLKARLQALGVPILPWFAHHAAIALAGVSIGDPVVVEAGVYFPHGQVIIDGIAEVQRDVTIAPWVTVGRIQHEVRGPVIGRDVRIGSGAKLLGPITIGDRATVGANSVVVDDVEPGTTVVGAPAKPVDDRAG